jgi:hypothetical protein
MQMHEVYLLLMVVMVDLLLLLLLMLLLLLLVVETVVMLEFAFVDSDGFEHIARWPCRVENEIGLDELLMMMVVD